MLPGVNSASLWKKGSRICVCLGFFQVETVSIENKVRSIIIRLILVMNPFSPPSPSPCPCIQFPGADFKRQRSGRVVRFVVLALALATWSVIARLVL